MPPLVGVMMAFSTLHQTTNKEIDMTTKNKVARRKLSLLELASEMNNVSRACQIMGYSRQQFYEIRWNFQTYGAQGLIDHLPGARGPRPNRVDEAIELAIIDHSLNFPTHGPLYASPNRARASGRASEFWWRQRRLGPPPFINTATAIASSRAKGKRKRPALDRRPG